MPEPEPLDHKHFDGPPERKNPVWFIIAAAVILLATGGALWSSMRMMGIV